jgi:hypothetical protein
MKKLLPQTRSGTKAIGTRLARKGLSPADGNGDYAIRPELSEIFSRDANVIYEPTCPV